MGDKQRGGERGGDNTIGEGGEDRGEAIGEGGGGGGGGEGIGEGGEGIGNRKRETLKRPPAAFHAALNHHVYMSTDGEGANYVQRECGVEDSLAYYDD